MNEVVFFRDLLSKRLASDIALPLVSMYKIEQKLVKSLVEMETDTNF